MSVRNLGGVALLLFGTTFVWITPMFAASEVDSSGVLWAVVGWLCLAVMVGFTVATWALFTRRAWWESLATVSAVVGIVTLLPYWFAATGSGVASPAFDVAIHALGSAGVLVLLRVPRLEHWVHGHVAAGH